MTTAKKFTTNETATIEKLPAHTLRVDDRVQRTLSAPRVQRMSNALDLDGLAVLTISRRPDGDYIIDGQHRYAALVAADMGDWEVDCKVYHGLTLAQEASLFRTLNETRVVGAFDKYTKGVLAGDPECVAVDVLVTEAGLRVAKLPSNGCIAAVRSLTDIYAKPGGPEALAVTLATIVQAWGRGRDSLDGFVIAGVGAVFLRYGGQVDHMGLSRKLAKRPGGPTALIGDARGMRKMRNSGTVADAMAEIIVRDYNSGKRSGRLG